jgi:hypothetical protein
MYDMDDNDTYIIIIYIYYIYTYNQILNIFQIEGATLVLD